MKEEETSLFSWEMPVTFLPGRGAIRGKGGQESMGTYTHVTKEGNETDGYRKIDRNYRLFPNGFCKDTMYHKLS